MTRDQRRAGVGVALLALLALALLAWLVTKGETEGTPPPPDAAHGVVGDVVSSDFPLDRDDAGAGSRSPRGDDAGVRDEAEERARIERERVSFEMRAPAEDYDVDPRSIGRGAGPHLRRYGGRSGRLEPRQEPEWADPTTVSTSRTEEPVLLGWTPTIRVQRGAVVPIRAALRDASGEVAPSRIYVQVFGEDPAIAADADMPRTAEGLHEHLYTVPASVTSIRGPTRIAWIVRAEGTYAGEPFTRSVTGFVLVQEPGGALDPTRAQITRGGEGIVLRIPARIVTPGNYWAYAELWGGEEGRTPIAFGRSLMEQVSAGERVVELLFGGAIVRDAGVDGPYTIRNVRFMRTDTVPPHEEEPIPVLATTPPWPASSFR